jgi:hypothetical protein
MEKRGARGVTAPAAAPLQRRPPPAACRAQPAGARGRLGRPPAAASRFPRSPAPPSSSPAGAPLIAAAMASAMPVLPLVASMIVSPFLIAPRRSASLSMCSAGRSFAEPAGLWPSSLARMMLEVLPGRCWRRTIGVPPTSSATVGNASRSSGAGARAGARGAGGGRAAGRCCCAGGAARGCGGRGGGRGRAGRRRRAAVKRGGGWGGRGRGAARGSPARRFRAPAGPRSGGAPPLWALRGPDRPPDAPAAARGPRKARWTSACSTTARAAAPPLHARLPRSAGYDALQWHRGAPLGRRAGGQRQQHAGRRENGVAVRAPVV